MKGFACWLTVKDGSSSNEEEANEVRISLQVEALEIQTLRKFGTAHSSTSIRTNALVRVRFDDHEGLSEVGLPPFKPGIYEGTYNDCERLVKTYLSLLVGCFGKQVTAWSSSGPLTETSCAWDGGWVAETADAGLEDLGEALLEGKRQSYLSVGKKMVDVLDFCMGKWQAKYPRSAYTLIETGLLNCMSRAIAAPLSAILGMPPAREAEPIHCFYTVGMTENLEELVENIRYGKSHTSFIKLKVDRDLSKAKRVLSLLDEEGVLQAGRKTIAIDANCSWTPETAHDFLKELSEYLKHIFMVEQPFPFDMPFPSAEAEGPLQDWVRVKALYQSQGIQIYADESMRTSRDVALLAPYCHGVNIKLEKCGGYREAVRAQALCAATGLNVWLGCMVGTALNCNAIVEILPLCNSAADMDGFLLVNPKCNPCEANFYLDPSGAIKRR
mmetsp:Transcript_12934/g.32681  ORF Transcript_12934/g.32681 Transcript_12934/m.32681 type:complete len:442 (-) Transcript_12934:108-1433(-)